MVMIIKIYDRDFEYTVEQVDGAENQLNTIAPGCTKERTRTFGRFEFSLTTSLTEEQKTTFEDWVTDNHPDWSVVWR
jgi:hypothetical protein